MDDYDELIGDLYNKSQEQAKEKYRISELASNYLKIIRNLPDDINFTIDFSTKSPSIYIKTNINATEESTEEFANLGEHGFLVENIYKKNEYHYISSTFDMNSNSV